MLKGPFINMRLNNDLEARKLFMTSHSVKVTLTNIFLQQHEK